MFEDTRPAALDASGGEDPLASFAVSHPRERAALLRQLRDGQQPVILNGADGSAWTTTLWAVDEDRQRLAFTTTAADSAAPALQRLLDADEAVAVAYMDSVKLQFDIGQLMLVRGAQAASVQAAMPRQVYRFQRRNSFRVRTAVSASQVPTAKLRHPSIPDMQLALRVLDLSIGGCALWYPNNLPPLDAGTRFTEVAIELDAATRVLLGLRLQHVTGQGPAERGQRLGCEWLTLPGPAERVLQRWIDQAQKRHRLLALDGT